MDNQDNIIPDPDSLDKHQDERVIPVIEEQAHVEKQEVETGKVYIRKQIQEEEATVEVPLRHDRVSVERVAINQYVSDHPKVRYEGDKIIIPVVQEEVVVEKKILLVEEMHIDRQYYQENFSETISLKKEIIQVVREDVDEPNPNVL